MSKLDWLDDIIKNVSAKGDIPKITEIKDIDIDNENITDILKNPTNNDSQKKNSDNNYSDESDEENDINDYENSDNDDENSIDKTDSVSLNMKKSIIINPDSNLIMKSIKSPVQESKSPVQESKSQVQEPNKSPVQEPIKSSVEESKSSVQESKSQVAESKNPVQDPIKSPVQEPIKSSVEESKSPVQEPIKSSVEESKSPVQEPIKSSFEESKSSVQESKSQVAESKSPVQEPIKSPVEEFKSSIQNQSIVKASCLTETQPSAINSNREVTNHKKKVHMNDELNNDFERLLTIMKNREQKNYSDEDIDGIISEMEKKEIKKNKDLLNPRKSLNEFVISSDLPHSLGNIKVGNIKDIYTDEFSYSPDDDNYTYGSDDREMLSGESMNIIPINPFFVGIDGGDLVDIKQSGILSAFKRVLILCLNTPVQKVSLKDLANIIFDKDATPDKLNTIKNVLTLIVGPIELLKTNTHKLTCKIILKKDLLRFNHKNFMLADEEIVIPMLNVDADKIYQYLSLYGNTRYLKDEWNKKLLLDFYKNSDYSVLKELRKLILTVTETDYWTHKYNCALNLTPYFSSRRFDYKGHSSSQKKHSSSDVEKTYEIKNTKNSNYEEFMVKRSIYIDARLITKYKNYILFKPHTPTLTSDDVTNFYKCCTSEQDLYMITCSILMSIDNFHLVLNNENILKELNQPNSFGIFMNNKSFWNKYAPSLRYVQSYCWIVYYLERSILGTKITPKDRCVYNANTASLLTFYPYVPCNPHLNPYLPILVSESELKSKDNMWGIKTIAGYTGYGIANNEEYKRNFNIFTTGKPDKNIFDNVDLKDTAISGSHVTACLQKEPPMLMRYKTSDSDSIDTLKQRLYNDQYKEADIDIMVFGENNFKYIDKVHAIYNKVKDNIMKLNNSVEVTLTSTKTLVFFISLHYIREKMPQYDIDYVIDNLHTHKFKFKFYQMYVNMKADNSYNEMKKYDNAIYDINYKPVDYSEKNIILIPDFIDSKKHVPFDSEYCIKRNGVTKPCDLQQNKTAEELEKENKENPILIKFSEGTKFHIKCPKMNIKIELFRSKFIEWFTLVSKFHLCCVRAYLDGDSGNVYMTSDFISSMMTYMNMDYKYFAGTKEAPDVFMKNLSRDFGTFINAVEKKNIEDYCGRIPKWKAIVKNSKMSKFFGGLTIDSDISKPGLWCSVENKIKSSEFKYVDVDVKYVTTEEDFYKEWKDRFDYDPSDSALNLLKLKAINKDGFIIPLNRGAVIDAFDLLQ
jgi:hypothetical protein